MKKLIALVCLCAFLTAGLVGCGEKTPSKPAPAKGGGGTPPPAGDTK